MTDTDNSKTPVQDETESNDDQTKKPAHKMKQAEGEIGGPKGLEPTRYGDWERKGIISDF